MAGATWSEFSRDGATWLIPAERAKNGRAHVVHLAPDVQAVLKALPRMKPKKDQAPGEVIVFALPGGGKLTAFSAIKRRIDAAIAAEEKKAADMVGREPEAMPPWTFHDFRRSGVTALAGLGFAPHVCDRLLNHVTRLDPGRRRGVSAGGVPGRAEGGAGGLGGACGGLGFGLP